MKMQKAIARCRVKPGKRLRLAEHDPGWSGVDELRGVSDDVIKGEARGFLQRNVAALSEAQDILWASDSHSVLMVLQGMDASGKDGTIKHVVSGVNPQGCRVVSFKQPSAEEKDHTFLWRCAKATPERGSVVIFNRSHYEDVLVTRVHPALLDDGGKEALKRGKAFWRDRYDDINAFERHLARNKTLILKFFLNVSKKEQKRRFLERLENREKHWKFSVADLAEREHWDEYQAAYEHAISATSTDCARWFVIPADNKWVTRALVASTLTHAIRSLKLKPPTLTPVESKRLAEAGRRLRRE